MNVYLQRLQKKLESCAGDLTGGQLTRRAAEGKWSVAEILEHLNLTYIGTIKNLSRSLKAGRALGDLPTMKQRVVNTLVLDFGYFPSGRESPESAKPKGLTPENIFAEMKSGIAALDDMMEKCETQFGTRAFVADHPVLGPLTLQQWRKFHWVHGKHHVRQIERMRD